MNRHCKAITNFGCLQENNILCKIMQTKWICQMSVICQMLPSTCKHPCCVPRARAQHTSGSWKEDIDFLTRLLLDIVKHFISMRPGIWRRKASHISPIRIKATNALWFFGEWFAQGPLLSESDKWQLQMFNFLCFFVIVWVHPLVMSDGIVPLWVVSEGIKS